MLKERVILHSDLNNFYATVECAKNPDLKDKPVCVCGSAEKRHGIVLAKNGIAKKFGIKTGDTIWEAQKKCGDLFLVEAKIKDYLQYSEDVHKIYERYTDKIESFGIDECWLDVTNSKMLFGDGKTIADKIRTDIKKELDLTVSIGVSWNKVFAKLGSDLKKPDATTIISKENFKEKLYNLNVREMLYAGRSTVEKLERLGITTIGGLANSDLSYIKHKFGKWGETLWIYANGLDDSEVAANDAKRIVKSVGNSTTLFRDLTNMLDVELVFTVLSESVSHRLIKKGMSGDVVSISVKDKDFEHWGKQIKLSYDVCTTNTILENALFLFKEYNFINPIRSLGVAVSNLKFGFTTSQIDMFGDLERLGRDNLSQRSVEDLRARFGHNSIFRANLMLDKKLTCFNPNEEEDTATINSFKR